MAELVDATEDEFRSLKVDTLRDYMRFTCDFTKGQFAAFATKDQCISVLKAEGDPYTIERIMRDAGFDPKTAKRLVVEADLATVDSGSAEVVLAEGTHGDGKEASNVASDDLMEKMVKMMGVLDPALAKEAEKVFEIAKQASSVNKVQDATIEDCGATVKIGKREYPKIVAADDPRASMIPDLDPEFIFNGFRARCSAGGSSITFKWFDVANLMVDNDRILLVGPPGTGKTKMPTQFCHQVSWPMYRVQGGRDLTIQDLVGTWTAKAGETIFEEGPLPRAMREGAVFLMDECDHNPPEISSVLHAVMEPGGKLVVTANGGDVVKPHANFRLIFTANTAGQGDRSGIHGAAKAQDAAFISRFDSVFDVTWMPPSIEKKVLSKFVQPDKADLMVKVAMDCRDAHEKGDLRYPLTHRHTISWAKKTAKLNDGAAAFAITVLSKSPECDRAAIAEVAQRHIGDMGQMTGQVPSPTP